MDPAINNRGTAALPPGLRFGDAALEAAFWQDLLQARQRFFTLGPALVALIIPLMSAWTVPHVSRVMAPTLKTLDLATACLCAGLPLLLASFQARRRAPWPRLQACFTAATLATGLGYAVLAALAEARFIAFYTYSIMHVLMFAHVFLVLPFARLCLIAPLILGAFSLALAKHAIEAPTEAMWRALAQVGSLTIVLLYAAYTIERSARLNFLYERQLRQEHADRHRDQGSRERWLATMSDFVRDQLGNVLTGVRSTLALMQRRGVAAAQPVYFQRAEDSAQLMQRLIAEAAAAGNLEAALASIHRSPVDLSALVEQKLSDYRQLYPRVRFSGDITGGITLAADADRLVQALDKLVHNAVEHTDGSAPVMLTLARSDAVVRLTVSNSGPQLDDAAAIFQPHVSSKASRDNLGLGLFVVDRIARAHGGSASARSIVQPVGAAFTVELPSGAGGRHS